VGGWGGWGGGGGGGGAWMLNSPAGCYYNNYVILSPSLALVLIKQSISKLLLIELFFN